MQITAVATPEHEEVYRVEDKAAGLLGFIALHSTKLGPAAGGLRMRPYASEDEALTDVLRLSRGMTYKNAAAGLPLGGGKAVIIGDPAQDKSTALLQAIGRAVASLGGRYWTAEDMGMTTADMAVIASETACVAGLAAGRHASGDPSPVTARGVFNAIRMTAQRRYGKTTLAGMQVAVQGLGNVGAHLCALLAEAGVQLTVADIDPARVMAVVAAHGARPCSNAEILAAPVDLLAPCAIGGILNAESIPTIRAGAVAGGANNQLATPEDGDRLHARGILYAPDFVANGGGIINVATEILRIDDPAPFVAERLAAMQTSLGTIFHAAAAAGCSPHRVAESSVSASMTSRAA